MALVIGQVLVVGVPLGDAQSALTVIESDEQIDTAYRDIVRQRGASMREQPDDLERALNILWSARALERIGDHSKNIGEYVVYLVRGQDLRGRSNPKAS